MALRDFFGGRRRDKGSTLPRGAKVVRRSLRGRGSDVGYWHDNQFFLLDGTLPDGSDYVNGTGEILTTNVARIELEREGYDADSYTAPASTSSTSSDSYVGNTGSGKSDYSYDGGSTGYYGGSYSGSDSGYSSDSSYGSSSSDSGSSYGGSSSSSSYDSGSSSSSSSSDY